MNPLLQNYAFKSQNRLDSFNPSATAKAYQPACKHLVQTPEAGGDFDQKFGLYLCTTSIIITLRRNYVKTMYFLSLRFELAAASSLERKAQEDLQRQAKARGAFNPAARGR